MKNSLTRTTILLCVISFALFSCKKDGDKKNKKQPTASFTYEIDPLIRGRVNLTNTSTNASTYFWEVWDKAPNGTLSASPSDGVSTSENPHFYIMSNSTIEIHLTVFNDKDDESIHIEELEITNIPSKLTIGKLMITRVSLMDDSGFEWDDADGIPNDGSYDFPDEYPDLLLNFEETAQQYEDNDAIWDVDIENGLPFEMTTDGKSYDSFSPQTWDYFIELVDFDGPKGSIFLGAGTRIGLIRINPYHLTHIYNDGDEGNYPSIYKIETDHFDADLHMIWE